MNGLLASARMDDRAAGRRVTKRALYGLVVLLAFFAVFDLATVCNLVSHSNIVVDERAEEESLSKSVQTLASLRRSPTGRLSPPSGLSELSRASRVPALDTSLPSAHPAGELASRNGIGAPLRC
jgi:hypothetical protein